MNRAGERDGSTAYWLLFFSPINLLLLAAITAVFRSLAESLLGGVDDVEEAVLVLLDLVDGRHERRRRRDDVVDEDEDGLLGRQLDAFTDDVDELAHR